MDKKTASDPLDYIRRREAQERAAAKLAPTLSARRVHQEMAQLYALLASRRGGAIPCPPEQATSRAIDSGG
jgi:hypothetical protein